MGQGRMEYRVSVLAIAAAAVLASVNLASAQPANNDCANAILVTDGIYSGSTVGASNDGSGTCGASQFSPDVWYEYTATFDGNLTVELCGSGYDTVAGIWTGCPGSGSEIACNDDACSLQSVISASINDGETYYIRISGYSSSTGSFTMDVAATEGGESTGPDVIYSNIGTLSQHGAVGNIRAYTLGSYTCNIGDSDLQWHNYGTPLLGMNAYRLADGRLEQIGMSWVKTACCAAAGAGCGMSCNGHAGSVLGAGCRDIYSSGWNSQQSHLGARSAVNPFTGSFSGVTGGSGNSIYKRLQIRESDMDVPGALFFAEGIYVGTDDAQAGNSYNNASYKRINIDGNYFMSEAGSMFVTIPAIYAWYDHGNGVDVPDPSVHLVHMQVPEEGEFVAAARASDNGDGTWRYTYAVFNINSHRSGGSFSVPVSAGTNVTGVGFHDVDYHSGEPYDNTDWGNVVDATSVTWSSPQTHSQNPNSNALRWGTMYTFWFDADVSPTDGEVTLGLFRPGDPTSVSATLDVPTATGPIAILSSEPPDGSIDARQPFDLNGNNPTGWTSIELTFDGDTDGLTPADFTVTTTGGIVPMVVDVATAGNTATLTLNTFIPVAQWTYFKHIASNSRVRLGYLPTDVTSFGESDVLDLALLIQEFNNPTGLPEWSTDMTRNGAFDILDIPHWIAMFNGSGAYAPGYSGVTLP